MREFCIIYKTFDHADNQPTLLFISHRHNNSEPISQLQTYHLRSDQWKNKLKTTIQLTQ